MTLTPVSPDVVARAVQILADPELNEEQEAGRMLALDPDPMVARRLTDWIPEAFGMVLLARLGMAHMPKVFLVQTVDEKCFTLPFSREPIFAIAKSIAQEVEASGPGEVFQSLALRSSLGQSVSNALLAGVEVRNLVCSGPTFIGLRAEMYLASQSEGQPAPRSFWSKLCFWK